MTYSIHPDLEARVLEALDLDHLLETAAELITLRSLGGEETAAQEYMAEALAGAGCEVDVWPLDFDALRRHPSYSAEIERRRGLGVVGMLGEGTGGRSLILNGHVDVVPAGDEDTWSVPAWQATRAGGRLYGRGSADMKGALACAVAVARALHVTGARLSGRLLIESVIGEEDGGCGTLATILRGHRANGAVVMEPTGLAIAPIQAGASNFRLIVSGAPAHACVREEGVSAVDKLLPLQAALLELEARRNREHRHPLFERFRLPWALSIGTLKAGAWPSTVPERLVAEGRYGLVPGEDVAAARHEFESAIRAAAEQDAWLAEHSPQVEWWGGQYPPAETAADDPLISALQSACEATGIPPRCEGVTYGSDMGILVHEGGIPTVLFGPGDVRRAHREDEWVAIAELEAAARALAILVLRYCEVTADSRGRFKVSSSAASGSTTPTPRTR